MEVNLRPRNMSEVFGQTEVVRRLSLVLKAARARNTMPGHILLSGLPGLGKTSLAHVIAAELDVPLVVLQGPMLDSPGSVLMALGGIRKKSVVLIDEIHSVSKDAEELLYMALEDGELPLDLEKSAPGTAGMRMPLADLTFVGATTKVGELAMPFRDRFAYPEHLHLYSVAELTQIILHNADRIDVPLTEDGAEVAASRSRGTPRIANNLLTKVGDWMAAQDGDVSGDAETVTSALDFWGIDSLGLDATSIRVLRILVEDFNGKPVGLTKIAAMMGESPALIESVYEPGLVSAGLMEYDSRGRVATDAGKKHLASGQV